MKNMGPEGGKIKILVDSFVCDEAQLIINTLRPGRLPLEFDIKSLKMTSIGPDGPMHFDADLTNPKPVGNVLSSGSFGPWQADSPRDTPVSGTYSFNHADLGTIKGMGGYCRPPDSMAVLSTTLSWTAKLTLQIFALRPAWASSGVRRRD
jgi:hypothetical protein